jgi:hypothetical protein
MHKCFPYSTPAALEDMTTHDAQSRNSVEEFEQPNGPHSGAPSIAFTLRDPPVIDVEADRKQDKPHFASNGDSSNLLIIDWDGPEDVENPKKQAFVGRL